jgi:hypothetical protein
MQHTTLAGSSATGRTGDGGDLLAREFVLFHPDRLQLHTVRNLCNSGHLRGLPPCKRQYPGRVRLRRDGVVVLCGDGRGSSERTDRRRPRSGTGFETTHGEGTNL